MDIWPELTSPPMLCEHDLRPARLYSCLKGNRGRNKLAKAFEQRERQYLARGRQSPIGSLLGNFGQRHVSFSGRRLPDDDLP